MSICFRIALVCLCLLQFFAAGAQEKRFIDVKHISLDLRLDLQQKTASGTADISFQLLAAADTVYFDGVQLLITSVTANGRPLDFLYDNKQEEKALRIILPRKMPAGELLQVQIRYRTRFVNDIDPGNLSGTNGKGLRFSGPSSIDPRRPREVYSVGEFTGNRYWFPCNDVLSDWRTTTLRITVESGLTVVASGRQTAYNLNSDGTATWVFSANAPYANHLTGVVASSYVPLSQKIGSHTLQSFAYLHETTETAASTVQLPEMFSYFSKALSHPYSGNDYAQVFVQDLPNWVGGNAMSIITENMVDDARTHADYFYLWDITEAEALASQWFGVVTGGENWNDLWINRGLCRYLAYCFAEQKTGTDELLSWLLPFDQGTYLSDWAAGIRRPIIMPLNEMSEANATDNYSYFRACAVMHMLRKQLGDADWWKVLQTVLKQSAGKPVSTQQFIQVVNTISTEPMDWFFEQWMYQAGHPVFQVSDHYDALKKTLYLTIRQIQSQDTVSRNNMNLYFRGKIMVAIDNELHEIMIDANPVNTYQFPASAKPGVIHVDVGNAWIKEMTYPKTWRQVLWQVQEGREISAKLWALNECNAMIAESKLTDDEKKWGLTSLLAVLDSPVYWRVKWAVVGTIQSLLPKDSAARSVLDHQQTLQWISHIDQSSSWLKSRYIWLLGNTRDSAFADLYIRCLRDTSERVTAAAAAALGKTGSSKAFPALSALMDKPSMKSQSILNALGGFMQLGDARAARLAYEVLADSSLPRWRLPNGSVWDYRVVAAQTIRQLGGMPETYPLLHSRYQRAIADDHQNDLFNVILLMATLGDQRAADIFRSLNKRYADNPAMIKVLEGYAAIFQDNLKKNR